MTLSTPLQCSNNHVPLPLAETCEMIHPAKLKCTCLGFLLAALLSAIHVVGDEPIYVQRTTKQRAAELKGEPWIDVIEREVAPLKNDPGDRLPMIMWHGVGFAPLSDDQLDVLRTRGLTQHLQMDAAMIPAALKLQQANMPVILMQGRTDNWPYSLADDASDWAHEFDLTYQPKWFGDEDAFEWYGACPDKIAGWKVLQQQTRQTMQQFKDAGVNVTGVWMDLEGDPYPWSHLFEQLRHCQHCRQSLTAEIVNNKAAWRDDAWQRYVGLYDQYFAQPVRDVFPDCLVTNWHVVASTKENPIRYFVSDVRLPTLSFQYFNATNPIAYGSDAVWRSRYRGPQPPTQAAVDRFFTSEILQQVQVDQRNRASLARPATAVPSNAQPATAVPSTAQPATAVPWVARYCRLETDDQPMPLMTRESYRMALSEIWKCDLASMQVFNAMHDGYEEYALLELQDAVQAYDDSLAGKE